MADNNYGLQILTDLNKALGYQGALTIPATAQAYGFSPTDGGISALRLASISLSSFDGFAVTSTFSPITLTAVPGVNTPQTTFDITVTNTSVPWGNVLDTVAIGVSSYGTALSGGGTGTMTDGMFTSAYQLSSIGIWTSQAEHSRLYINGEI